MESLVQHFSQWVSFYYTYHNRYTKSANKLMWFYKGGKKILQIVLNHVHKMKQFEELL